MPVGGGKQPAARGGTKSGSSRPNRPRPPRRIRGARRAGQDGDQVNVTVEVGDDGETRVVIDILDPPQEKQPAAGKSEVQKDEDVGAASGEAVHFKAAKKALSQSCAKTGAPGPGGISKQKIVDDVKRLLREAGKLIESHSKKIQAVLEAEEEAASEGPSPIVAEHVRVINGIITDCSTLTWLSLSHADGMGPKLIATLGESLSTVREWADDFSTELPSDNPAAWVSGAVKGRDGGDARIARLFASTAGIIAATNVSDKIKAQRQALMTPLSNVVETFFRDRKIQGLSINMFGSIASRLDTPSSDIDLNLTVSGPVPDAYMMKDGKSATADKCWECGLAGHQSRQCPNRVGRGKRAQVLQKDDGGATKEGTGDKADEADEAGGQVKELNMAGLEIAGEEEQQEAGADGEDGDGDGDGDGEDGAGEDEEEGEEEDEEEEEEEEIQGPNIDKKTILMELSKALRNCKVRKMRTWAIVQARVPLIKVTDYATNINCDISMESELSQHKSNFLRAYVSIDPRLRELLALVKHWAKARNINDATSHTLNSFAYTMMVIQFLQTRSPPILPCLHAPSLTCKGVTKTLPPACAKVQGIEIRYHGCDSETGDHVSFLHGFGEENKATVQELVIQFFNFIAREVNIGKDCFSVAEGRIKPADKSAFKHKHSAIMCVEDPFDPRDNVARSVTEASYKRIIAEFVRAGHVACETGDMEAICTPCQPVKEKQLEKQNSARQQASAKQAQALQLQKLQMQQAMQQKLMMQQAMLAAGAHKGGARGGRGGGGIVPGMQQHRTPPTRGGTARGGGIQQQPRLQQQHQQLQFKMPQPQQQHQHFAGSNMGQISPGAMMGMPQAAPAARGGRGGVRIRASGQPFTEQQLAAMGGTTSPQIPSDQQQRQQQQQQANAAGAAAPGARPSSSKGGARGRSRA